jgi:Ca2+-transporting ATPase
MGPEKMQMKGSAPPVIEKENPMEKKKETFYNQSAEQAMQYFHSGKDGISDAQAEKNREEFGANRLRETKKKSFLQVFADQFKDLLVIILIVAAVVSMLTGSVSSTVVIFLVLIMNAILGTVQYFKAQKSLEGLKKLSSPEAKVIREGTPHIIDATDLVCGDIITLEAGDIVPGDGRIIESFSLKTDESTLTGESMSVEKHARVIDEETVALGDQKNMVFSGSLVTYGRATAVITAVGKETELGQIAELMNDTSEKKTPLQVTMDQFSKKLSIAIMAICAVVFLLSMYRGMHILDALLFAVALAVAAIPEALSSIITISLAIGTSRMAEQNAIVKDLNAVEGLGCVSVICSDKTGTLTQNRMTVEYADAREDVENEMMMASVLCNDTKRVDGKLTGDPTETAYFDYYIKECGEEALEKVLNDHPRLAEVPFDSDRKLMSTLHKVNGEYVMFIKGAIDVIMDRTVNLTDEEIDAVRKENMRLSSEGLRVLGFAMKTIPENRKLTVADEFELDYIGLLAEVDPPREESKKAVADCIAAGIKPIMITGDHKVTASAIAKRIGIMHEGDLAFTGPEIDAMSDEELDEKLEHISVYARVSPSNKIRIVNAWQKKGKIVAMTGDGVNDGPALKAADVGVAMGITGTEVAKDSAAMILTDDNFATIIKSVLNGRNIYNNIKNAITYLLSGNAAAILDVLFASLAGLSAPFTAVQLLFINLITDSLPALAISMEPSNPELIYDKPRSRDDSVLNKETQHVVAGTGILIAIAVAAAFLIGLGKIPAISSMMPEVSFNATTGCTMAFATLCLARLWHGFNCRGRESIFKLGILSNMYTIGAFVLGAGLLHCILLIPALHSAFGTSGLNPHLLGWVWLLAFLPTVIIQIYKAIRYGGEEKISRK